MLAITILIYCKLLMTDEVLKSNILISKQIYRILQTPYGEITLKDSKKILIQSPHSNWLELRLSSIAL